MNIGITGGGSEIARAIALRRLKMGDSIFITSSSMESLLESLTFFKNQGYPNVEGFVHHLEDPAASQTALDVFIKKGIDGLILNASTRVRTLKPFHEMDPLDFKSQVDANIYGNVWLLQKILPQMIEKKFGRLLFISSVSATQGTSRYAAYCLAKSAMEGLFLNLAVDYGNAGIAASIIRPGLIATSRNKKFWSRGHYAEKMATIIPQGALGTPDQVAEATDPLLSNNTYMNGSVVTVAGGLPMMNSKGLLSL
ncbi:MAG: SDR family oxidoreductase [Bdellovibrionales bacterium]|nr:SDR family oxidoreductase [Bdellovibrionales bacterium]